MVSMNQITSRKLKDRSSAEDNSKAPVKGKHCACKCKHRLNVVKEFCICTGTSFKRKYLSGLLCCPCCDPSSPLLHVLLMSRPQPVCTFGNRISFSRTETRISCGLITEQWSQILFRVLAGAIGFADNLTPDFRQRDQSSFPPLSDETVLRLFAAHN